MKKIEVLIFLYILASIGIVYSQGSSVGVGISILDSGPIISLIEPLNNSGDIDGNITFIYNVNDGSNVDNCSLIINDVINTTDPSIVKDTRINFTVNQTVLGSYNWSINCTDDQGLIGISEDRTYSVVFLNNFNGSTTDISLVDIRNITNLVLEVLPYGKINYSVGIDLSQGVDVDNNVNITKNRIELNSTAIPGLNKSATLSLFDITFTDPRPLRDGAVCPSSICTELPFSGNTFIFEVTQFTVYSSEETPDTTTTTTTTTTDGGGGAGGGGGGGPVVAKREFTISREALTVTLKQGQSKEESLTVKNTGEVSLDIKTFFQTVKKFIISPDLEEIEFILKPNDEQTIDLIFKAEKNQTPNIYTGEIKVISGSTEKIVSTIIEVESAKPLFDVDVEVLPQYKNVAPGDEIVIAVSAFNIRGFGRVDVNLEYSIRDFQGNLIVKEEETVAVETQAKFTRELLVPSDLKPGIYIAAAIITFEDSVGISTDIFEVSAKAIRLYPIEIKDFTFFLLLGIVFIVFSASAYLLYEFKVKKDYVPKTKEEVTKVIKSEEKTSKFRRELSALEQAHKSKFISKESYNRDKVRIENQLKKLGK